MPRQNKATRSPEISRQQVQKPRASHNACQDRTRQLGHPRSPANRFRNPERVITHAKTEQGNSVTRDLPPTGSETPERVITHAKTEQGNSVTRDLPPTGSETPSES